MCSHNYLILSLLILSIPGLKSSDTLLSTQCMSVVIEINCKAVYKEAGLSQFGKNGWVTCLFKSDKIFY